MKGIDKKKVIKIGQYNENHINQNIVGELLDPNLGVKDILKKISTDPVIKSNFETLLKKNYNIANWFFWLEVTSLVEQKREDEEILHKIQEITQKYLLESSFDEVTKFFF